MGQHGGKWLSSTMWSIMSIIGSGMGWILPGWGSSLNSYALRMVGKLFSYLVRNVVGDLILGGDQVTRTTHLG